ncbi:MAG TPA: electron transfer flavoprotein-ubiquinone oxidoreductase [Planctomycetota bacterium]|nr:electron transfer flavoprotein-ubiquinone oxidoreductase [Planctomycetota bacterium]
MAEREILDVDVLIVGAGPAGLSCAIQLHDLAQQRARAAGVAFQKPNILVIEKGINVGAHSLSGAVFDTRALDELIPDWKHQGAPVTQRVTSEDILFLTHKRAIPLPSPLVPPYLHNKGNYVISVGELTKWLAEQARKRGVEILEGVAGAELVTFGNTILGVRCGDMGIGKDGKPRATFQAGAEIHAKVTVLGEGVRGSLTKQLIRMHSLDSNRHPQTYALGVKEIWELPAGTFPAGKIIHTLGFPLQKSPMEGWYLQEQDFGIGRGPVGIGVTATDSFGGSFIYGLDETRLIIGLVVGLDYKDPYLDPHYEFNRFKMHPFVSKLLDKGKIVQYGAKAIPEGGYYSMPRFYGDGFCLIGDSASFLNAARLKGVHLAMKSGMLAAEAIEEALVKKDYSLRQLGRYEDLFQTSWAREELYAVRNWRAGYAEGLAKGAIHDMAQRYTEGKGFTDPIPVKPDHEMLERFDKHHPNFQGLARLMADGKLTFDKVTDVFHSGTNHAEEQPCHLKVPDLNLCIQRCTAEYGNPCQHFCPAGVYEWIQPQVSADIGVPDKGHLHINPGNCVHCKTCDIKDPYENILWVVPEGGGGPRYQRM